MADYTDYGYDNFLSMPDENNNNGTTGIAFDNENLGISGDLVQGGIMQSVDKNTTVDLQNGFINISDGSTDIIQLGKFPDGSYGLIVKDRSGNVLMQFTGDINLIQSPGKNMILDFNAIQLGIFDDTQTPVTILGLLSS